MGDTVSRNNKALVKFIFYRYKQTDYNKIYSVKVLYIPMFNGTWNTSSVIRLNKKFYVYSPV